MISYYYIILFIELILIVFLVSQFLPIQKNKIERLDPVCQTKRTSDDIFVSYFDIFPPGDNIGSGFGVNQPGLYYVFLEWESDRRFAIKATDSGHEDWFCAIPDMVYDKCRHIKRMKIDGVHLMESSDYVYHKAGMKTNGYRVYLDRIYGPYQKKCKYGHSGWEWNKRGNNNHCKSWTTRKTPIMSALYLVNWTGEFISSKYQIQWNEPDEPVGDDYSIKKTIELGNALTRSLRRAQTNNKWNRSGTKINQKPLYTYICHEVGGCENPRDYKFEIYYNIFARISKVNFGSDKDLDFHKIKLYDDVVQSDTLFYTEPRANLRKIFGIGDYSGC